MSVLAILVVKEPSVTTHPETTDVCVQVDSLETPMWPVQEAARSSVAPLSPVPLENSAARASVCVSEDSREKPPASVEILTSVPSPRPRSLSVVRTPSVRICPAPLTANVQLDIMVTPSSRASLVTVPTVAVLLPTMWTPLVTASLRAVRPRPSVQRGRSVSVLRGACPTAHARLASTATLMAPVLTSTSVPPPPDPVGLELSVKIRLAPSAACVP